MKKVIIAPDSFKGSLSSILVADIVAEEVLEVFPDCTVVKMPIADGGEGSIDTIITTIGGNIYEAEVLSPDDRLISASFGIAADGTAIVEMAQSSGITKQKGLNPMTSSTYGFGQLILAALNRGARDFTLCIGGSATTDAGCGMAAALGIVFADRRGIAFTPCGGTLNEIMRIDTSGIDKRIKESKFTVMCDVDNPLHGTSGAAHVYGPQKGADSDQVHTLDEGLQHFGTILYEQFGMDYASIPGAGAAGGLGAGCIAFLEANLVNGSEAILKLCDYKKHLVGADLIITGEGRLDMQSFNGKVLSGILREAGDIPVFSICGACECDDALLREHGLSVFETSEGISVEESIAFPAKYIKIAAKKVVEVVRQGGYSALGTPTKRRIV